jgi:hypothetical protein
MIRDARIVGNHRYWLTRTWSPRLPRVTFVGLNPSTADDSQDDATIRKCIGFSRLWKMGGLLMLNLFTYRATQPRDLVLAAMRGMINGDVDEELNGYNLIPANGLVICCWGSSMKGDDQDRPRFIMNRLREYRTRALHINKDGSPKHPLYVAYTKKLLHYRGVNL